MLRTQIYLPKSQLDTLRILAHKRQTTVSDITRRLLDVQLRATKHRGQQQKPAESFVDFARRISKIGKKAPKDLSMNLDHYLYGTPKRYKRIP